ncbi:MAG: hypothetical protein ACLP5H_15440 [Desulfomonilaceae bacterium]
MAGNLKWDLDAAVTLLKEGKNYREVAETMGLKRSQVYGTLRSRGLTKTRGPGGRKLSWNFTKARELLEQGKSVGGIAEEMGLTYGQVYSALRCRGLSAPPGERGRKQGWDLNYAIGLLNGGKSCGEIAETLGMSRAQVRSAFRYRGIIVKQKDATRECKWDIKAAKELADQGKGLHEIARFLGVQPNTIKVAFKRLGWEVSRKNPGLHVKWDVGKAAELRQKGWPWVKIDQELELPRGTVRGYFTRHGLHTPRHQPNMKWDITEAQRMREQGFGWKEIGERVGTHGNNVRRAMARLEVQAVK